MAEVAGSYRCYVVWALMAAFRMAVGFNVDLTTASLRSGEADSMFGFTVAQHVDHGQPWSVHFLVLFWRKITVRHFHRLRCSNNVNRSSCHRATGIGVVLRGLITKHLMISSKIILELDHTYIISSPRTGTIPCD